MELLPSLATALRQPIAPAHLAESPPVKQRSLSAESAPANGEGRNVPDSDRGARGGPSRVAVRLAVSQNRQSASATASAARGPPSEVERPRLPGEMPPSPPPSPDRSAGRAAFRHSQAMAA